MYKDLLGKNREYVEAQMRGIGAYNMIVDTSKEYISYKIRENLSIGFNFVENEVERDTVMYSEEVSPEKVIEEIGYEFSECQQVNERTYTIQTSTGVEKILVYNTSKGTWASFEAV